MMYTVDAESVANYTNGTITATLKLQNPDTTKASYAMILSLTLSFYQNGIMRCLIEEPDNTRFRISDYDLPVVEE